MTGLWGIDQLTFRGGGGGGVGRYLPVKPKYLYVPASMTGGTLCFRIVRPSFRLTVHPSHIRSATFHATPHKNYAFSTNYHACIAMPTWRRYAPSILIWPLPPYNLLPSLCITSAILNAEPNKLYDISTYCHIYCNAHIILWYTGCIKKWTADNSENPNLIV